MGKEIYRRTVQGNPELTRASVKPKLESGDIFMAKLDGGSGDIQGPIPEQGKTKEPQRATGRLSSARRSLSARIRPATVAHAHLDNPGQPVDPFGDEFGLNVEVRRAWLDYLADDNPEKAAREAQITALGYQEDVKAVYDLENRELTQEAKDTLRRFGSGELTLESMPEDFSRILEENGISRELIEKYQDQPAILRFSLLFSRNESNINHEIDSRAVSADTDIEEPRVAPESATTPAEPTVDMPEPEARPANIKVSDLSEEDQELLYSQLDQLERARQMDPLIRSLTEGLTAQAAQTLSNPESKRGIEEFWSNRLGRPVVFNNPSELAELMVPFRAMDEEVRREMMDRRRGHEIYVPKSLEELTKLVMNRATPEYKKGGEYPLLNYKKIKATGENGEEIEIETDIVESVNTVNFMRWARDNYILVHLNNPTIDVNFFSDVATNVRAEGFGGTLSFYEITATEGYFLQEVRDPETGEVRLAENEEYKQLRQQMLLEVYTLQILRNPAISYVLKDRAEREKMLGAIANANVLNPITKFFDIIFTQPSMQAQSIVDLQGEDEKGSTRGRELQAKREGNFAMGTSTREILAAFMTITDYQSLRKIFTDPDCPLFTYEYDAWDVDTGKKDVDGKKKTTAPDRDEGNPEVELVDRETEWYYTQSDVDYLATRGVAVKKGGVKLFKMSKGKPVEAKLLDADGNLAKELQFRVDGVIPSDEDIRAANPDKPIIIKRENSKDKDGNDIVVIKAQELDPVAGEPLDGFMRWLNIFLTPTPDQRQQDEVRQRFRLAVMQRNGISFREAQSAELMAYSVAQIGGAAAAADVDAVGFDWWTRMLRFRDKRKREKSSSRNASYGSEFNMEGVKRIALTFFEGARDLRGRSIQKLILGGEGRDIHTSSEESPLKKKVDYKRDDLGRIVFETKDGAPVELDVWGYKLVNRTNYEVIDDKGNAKKDQKVVMPRNVAEVVFLDRDGNVVDVGENVPRGVKISDLDTPIDFESDLQKQFHPNHLLPGSKIYQWVFSQKGMDFAHMVEGEDSRANPIFKWGDINEIKHGLIHDIRYMVKTWGKINFAETHVYTEKVEVRNARGRLVGTHNGHEVELDEAYYIMHDGKRGHERIDPKTYFVNKEMTVLESMFDYDALYYIDQELRAARPVDRKPARPGDPNTFTVKDPLGKRPDITIDYSEAAKDPTGKGASNFSGAVWKGMFDYMVAAEIESHRTPGSGYDFQNYVEIRKIKEVLELSGMLDSYQVNMIWKRLGLNDSALFSQYLATEMASGGISGLFKALMAMAKGAIS